MSDVTDDQFTCLMIANNGDSLAPIGRWKEPVLELARKGLLQRLNEVNYAITLEGRKACAERDREDDAALGRLLESSSKVGQVQRQSVELVESAAQNLAAAASWSAKVTGDDPIYALRQWSEQALKRALELIK